jgi:hypothetical protein
MATTSTMISQMFMIGLLSHQFVDIGRTVQPPPPDRIRIQRSLWISRASAGPGIVGCGLTTLAW